jgi:hypothetical protein
MRIKLALNTAYNRRLWLLAGLNHQVQSATRLSKSERKIGNDTTATRKHIRKEMKMPTSTFILELR